MLHRLHATLLVDDIDELKGMEVHHVNGCPFDNRLENYQLITPDEHRKLSPQGIKADNKALCRESGEVLYSINNPVLRYCPKCGSQYDAEEIVSCEYINWQIQH